MYQHPDHNKQLGRQYAATQAAKSASNQRSDPSAYIDFSDPESSLDSLLPSLMTMAKPEVTHVPEVSSALHQQQLESRGMIFHRVNRAIRSYPAAMYEAHTRRLDNCDLFKGKPQIYGTSLATALPVYHAWKQFNDWFIHYCESRGDMPAKVDLGDAQKACYQFIKPTAWWMSSPITEADVPAQLSASALEVLAIIAKRGYRAALDRSEVRGLSRDQLMALDSDPDDTNAGAPTYETGDRTHQARLAVLAALPDPHKFSPSDYVVEVARLASQLELPDRMIWSPIVSTRMGPIKKPVPLWYPTGEAYASTYSSLGLLNRTRFVYPAPFWLNLLWSPWYEQLSNCRKQILGLWHTPDLQDKYIQALQKQGSFCYAVDFSGMDTAMFQVIILSVVDALLDAGFDSWTGNFIRAIYPEMGIMFPDFYGDPKSAMIASGPIRPWCSGFKLTSEMDTIYGTWVLLFCLREQIPDILERWLDGRFVYAELGDDILFTLPHAIDVEKFKDTALREFGATLKVEEDVVFLKWELPIHPEVPKKTRLFSRFLQQTLANEDRYVGEEGGDVPDCVMRLALIARSAGLQDNPMFTDVWPRIMDILDMLPYIQSAPQQWRDDLRRGVFSVHPDDEAGVLQYAYRNPRYISKLIERAKYEPSAAYLLATLQSIGITTDQAILSGQQARALYMNALFSDPTSVDIVRLRSLTDQSAS